MRLSLKLAIVPLALLASVAFAQAPITLDVDLTDAPRHLFHATETIVVKPGPLTLLYAKWIPGEHGPTGPIDNFTFTINADTDKGSRIPWTRDTKDMFVFHLTVPAGVSHLDIHTDYLVPAAATTGFSSGASVSSNLAVLSWNSVLLYPDNVSATDLKIKPAINLPESWHSGTALEGTDTMHSVGTYLKHFKPVSLETLIDSPVLAGRWFREIPIAEDITPKHYLDLAGDGPEDLDLSKQHIEHFARLVRETGLLYKSRHYGSYHFFVTLSDQVAHFGLEHHQSSDDRVAHATFTDENQFILNGLLLPHEFTHSWNGKYRRPAGLATGDYQKPMEGDLLWVYEGLTEYLGDVLASRCGVWPPGVYRDRLANVAAYLNDLRPGRQWRNLQDTATAAQTLYAHGLNSDWDNVRRNVDYYDEGELLWLEVDLIIRDKSAGKKSLNDFAAAFEGLGGNTQPKVVPYTFADIVSTLNTVLPYDWATFLRKRLDSNDLHAPEIDGINALAGYKLVYTPNPNYWTQLNESVSSALDTRYSLGLQLTADGHVADVIRNSPADAAGFAPGMHVLAVNGRGYNWQLLRTAIQDAADAGSKQPMEFIVEFTGYYKTIRLDYHGGEKYPDFHRIEGVPTHLDDILQPMAR